MLKSILYILFAIFSLNVFAQNDSLQVSFIQKSKHQVGLSFGGVTGIGFAYKYTRSKFSHQFTFLPIFIPSDLILLDFAYTLSYRTKETKYLDYNLYLGNHTFGYSTSENGFGINATGGGAGINIKIGKRLCTNLNLGAAFLMQAGFKSWWLPTAEFGVYYKLLPKR